MIFNSSLLNLLYKAKKILINDRDLRPAILIRNKISFKFKKDLSAKDLINKYRYICFKLSAINGERIMKLFTIIIRLIKK